jgi:hypothetical protein
MKELEPIHEGSSRQGQALVKDWLLNNHAEIIIISRSLFDLMTNFPL